MPRNTYAIIRGESFWYVKGKTVLDVVRDTIACLDMAERVPRVKPALTQGLDECLSRYKEGTYRHWAVSTDVARHKKSDRKLMGEFEKSRCETRRRNAKFAAQRAALEDKISGLQKLEKLLVSKGAQTFAQLHPSHIEENPSLYRKRKRRTPGPGKPYEYRFDINHVSDLTVRP